MRVVTLDCTRLSLSRRGSRRLPAHRAEDLQAVEVDASHGENDAPDLFILCRRPIVGVIPVHAKPRPPRVHSRSCPGGLLSLAAAMGIGRFAFTPAAAPDARAGQPTWRSRLGGRGQLRGLYFVVRAARPPGCRWGGPLGLLAGRRDALLHRRDGRLEAVAGQAGCVPCGSPPCGWLPRVGVFCSSRTSVMWRSWACRGARRGQARRGAAGFTRVSGAGLRADSAPAACQWATAGT
jgi:hypothetical protein